MELISKFYCSVSLYSVLLYKSVVCKHGGQQEKQEKAADEGENNEERGETA